MTAHARVNHDQDAGADAQALLQLWRDDPFAVLGPHPAGKDRWVIRVLAPHAVAVTVLAADVDTAIGEMRRIHDIGLFACVVNGAQRPSYRLRIESAGASAVTMILIRLA